MLPRAFLAVVALATGTALAGCAAVIGAGVQFAVEEAAAVRLGPCRGSMGSVTSDRGKPRHVYRTTVDEGRDRPKVFWHEWGYPLEDSTGVRADSVIVVGFLWSDEPRRACTVRERRESAPGPNGDPWNSAGRVPAT